MYNFHFTPLDTNQMFQRVRGEEEKLCVLSVVWRDSGH